MNTPTRTLTLIRHAKSSWKQPLPDFERPLNKRGRRDAPELGKWLVKHEITFDRIVTSPARRALETATLVARELAIPDTAILLDESVYLASMTVLFDRVRRFADQYHHIALIGHNPGISSLADYLLADGLTAEMRTCACVHMQFATTSWAAVVAHQGELLAFHDPKSPKSD